MRGEAFRGDTIPSPNLEFDIATAFEITFRNQGKARQDKARLG